MTSEVFCNVRSSSQGKEQLDPCLQDTLILMASTDFGAPSILQEDLSACKLMPVANARSVGWTAETQPLTACGGGAAGGGGGDGQDIHPGPSTDRPAGPPNEIGEAAAGGSAASGGGGDEPHGGGGGNRGGGPDAEPEDESHEQPSGESSSTSSGSVPALIAVPNPELFPLPPDEFQHQNNNNHHDLGEHSEGSGISEATTALVSDTDVAGQDVVHFDPASCGLPQSAGVSGVRTSGPAVKDNVRHNPENVDANSTATSTLSSFTTSSSSGKDDKKSLSVTDGSIPFETSKLDISCASEPIDTSHEASKQEQAAAGEKLMEFHISQEDMFVCTDDRFTSTPSETVAILGFSREPIAGTDTIEEEGDMIIPPSPEDCQPVVPFLIPSTPSVLTPEVSDPPELQVMEIECETDRQSENLKWSLTEDISSETESPRKKAARVVQTTAEGSSRKADGKSDPGKLETDAGDSSKKKPSQKAVAAAKISQYLMKSLQNRDESEPSTSCHSVVTEEQLADEVSLSLPLRCPLRNPTSENTLLSEAAVRKMTFDSESQSSQQSLSDGGKRAHDARRPAINMPTDARGVFSVGEPVEPPCPEIIQLLQLEIDNLGQSANDKAADPMISGQTVACTTRKLAKVGCILSGVGSDLQKSDKSSSSNGSKYQTTESSKNNVTLLKGVSGAADESTSKPLISRESEESQDGDNDLILHYSPSQNAESQYFHLEEEEEVVQSDVAEVLPDSEDSILEIRHRERLTLEDDVEKAAPRESFADCISDSEKENSKSNVLVSAPPQMKTKDSTKEKLADETVAVKTCLNVEDIRLNVESETSLNGASLPSFHLNPTQALASVESNFPEAPKSPPRHKALMAPSASGKQLENSSLGPEGYEDEVCNPFESCVVESNGSQPGQARAVSDEGDDELDVPVCPTGRHKRRLLSSEDSQAHSSGSKKKRKICSKSCQVELGEIGACSPALVTEGGVVGGSATRANQTRDQAIQTAQEESGVKNDKKLFAESKDLTDGTSILRHTLIIKRIVIQEILCKGKVVKRTVEEVIEDPVITEFGSRDEGNPSDTFLHPTPSNKPSPESLSTIKSSSSSSLNKSTCSTSGTSACLADISSSKSSGSSSATRLASPTPPAFASSLEVTSVSPQSSFHQENKVGVSGMKTLRSVKRRQRFEIRKSLNLSSPEDKPSPPKTTAVLPAPVLNESTHGSASKTPNSGPPSKRTYKPKKKKPVMPALESKSSNQPLVETPVKRPGKKTKRSKDAIGNQHSIDSNNISPKKISLPRDSCAPARDPFYLPSSPFRRFSSPCQSFDLDSSTLQPGVRVMAKWRDGYYYPGRAVQPEKDDRWQIRYDDGDEVRSIKMGSILVVDVLPVGQSIYAKSPDDYFDSGIIIDHYNENDETGYIVEIDGGVVRRVPRTEAILTHDQASCVKDLPGSTMHGYTSICLDNIIEGTRRSRETSLSGTPISPQPRSPRTPKRARLTSEGVASTSKMTPDVHHVDSDSTSTSTKSSKGAK